jgi:hypothetical protein
LLTGEKIDMIVNDLKVKMQQKFDSFPVFPTFKECISDIVNFTFNKLNGYYINTETKGKKSLLYSIFPDIFQLGCRSEEVVFVIHTLQLMTYCFIIE